MEKVVVIVDPMDDGFWGQVNNLHCTVSFGRSMLELEENLRDAISEALEDMKDQGSIIPDVFTEEYDFEYQLRLDSLFDLFPQIKQTAIAAYAEINSSLVRQYARNIKQPGPKQLAKVEKAIHQLGKELLKVRLVSPD